MKAKQGMATPWGPAETADQFAPGIVLVSTMTHGGFGLSESRIKAVETKFPDHKPFACRGWYEEDCDWRYVAMTFPQFFEARDVKVAKQIHADMAEVTQ